MDSKAEPLTISTEGSKKKTVIMFIASSLAIILAVSTIVVAIKLSSKASDYDELESKYNNLESQYEKQNSTMNDVFNSVHDLIQNTTMDKTVINKDDFKNVKEKLKQMKNNTDGTYSFITLEPISYDSGYHVGFETKTRANDNNYYSDEEYDNIVYKIAALLGVNPDIGVYKNKPEISFLVKDINLAFSLAAVFNQETIWDWANSKALTNTLHQIKYF